MWMFTTDWGGVGPQSLQFRFQFCYFQCLEYVDLAILSKGERRCVNSSRLFAKNAEDTLHIRGKECICGFLLFDITDYYLIIYCQIYFLRH
jgi:hypothetical protein